MNEGRLGGSFFPASKVIITGGSFNSHVYTGETGGYKRLLNVVATNALHDSGHVFDPPRCHPGTRVKIIQTIIDWSAGADDETRTKSVNWLTGPAGSGKSAIGRTVCEHCAKKGTLLASFFFSSTDASRNHSKALVATIAYQISAIDASIRNAVSQFIDNDPHIFSKSLRTQFVSLVVEPLLASYASGLDTLRRLIVIDGLDECGDPSSQRDILETITYLIKTYPHSPIRFLVCSRSENSITNVIHGASLYPTVFTIVLSDDYAANADIRLYLSDNFNDIRQGHIFKHLLPDYWPSDDDLLEIIHKSSGQFIYASTVVKYIQSEDEMPHRRLEIILGLRPPHGDLPFAQLDALYTHILTTTKKAPAAAKILAFIAMYPNACTVIARYVELEDEEVEIILSKLAAIVGRTRDSDDGVCDRFELLHKSFEDFLFDQSRSKELYVSFPDTLASHILRSIKIFSEVNDGCRFQRDILRVGEAPFSIYKDVFRSDEWFSDCNNAMKTSIIDALLEFPMGAFCKELYSFHRFRCPEFAFTHFLLSIIFTLKEHHTDFEDTYNQYMAILSKYAVRYLPVDDGPDSLQCNFHFSVGCIKPSRRFIDLAMYKWVWEVIWFILRYQGDAAEITSKMSNMFKPFLTKADYSHVFPRAALYCLQFLCDSIISTRDEAERHLKVPGMEKQRRHSRPWAWHRQTSAHKTPKNEKRFFLYKDTFQQKSNNFCQCYAELPKLQKTYYTEIYSFESFDWKNVKSKEIGKYPQRWKQYLAYLEYLLEILPLVGRYPPLIEYCKTKAFGPMSMMFPALSRRARQAIDEYLKRMELEDNQPQISDEVGTQDSRAHEAHDNGKLNSHNSSLHEANNKEISSNDLSRQREETEGELNSSNEKISPWNDDNLNHSVLAWSLRHFIRNICKVILT